MDTLDRLYAAREALLAEQDEAFRAGDFETSGAILTAIDAVDEEIALIQEMLAEEEFQREYYEETETWQEYREKMHDEIPF